MNYFSAASARWADADHLSIIADVVFREGDAPVSYNCASYDPVSKKLFDDLNSLQWGEIAPYSVPATDPAHMRQQIEMICMMQIGATLKGKGQSLLRQAAFLQSQHAGGQIPDMHQQSELAMFDAINNWETAMIEAREKFIAAGNLDLAETASAWPVPPAGLDAFLTGF